ncbi:MAG: 3-phosphoshikimate 1-carboxyvinyltransferase [Nitrososphaerales archaeon]
MVRVRVYPSTIEGSIKAPPSKSYSHRAIVLASLAEGTSVISNPLFSRDTLATVRVMRQLGAIIKEIGHEKYEIEGASNLNSPSGVLDVENSGTTIRFATSICSLTPQGTCTLTGDSSIRKRPMGPLLDSLNSLGVDCWSSEGDGRPPIVVRGGGLRGGEAAVDGSTSSQFLSSLLISCPKAIRNSSLKVTNELVSRPYVDATIWMMSRFGVKVERDEYRSFSVQGGQSYRKSIITVPGDPGSASFFLIATMLGGGSVRISGIDTELPQAELSFLDIARALGAEIAISGGTIDLIAPEVLHGGSFDLKESPDLLPPLAMAALKADSPIRITGVEHTRSKESDRISALATELSKLGFKIKEGPSYINVDPTSELKSEILDAHNDHRLFMAFCALGTAMPDGLEIEGLESVDVSYPTFLDDLSSLGAKVEVGNH